MKRPRFETRALWIEAQRDQGGWIFTSYAKGCSCFIATPKELLRWAGYPAGTPTRIALEAWLKELIPVEEPDTTAELKATGFGPEQHDDDPTANTKTII